MQTTRKPMISASVHIGAQPHANATVVAGSPRTSPSEQRACLPRRSLTKAGRLRSCALSRERTRPGIFALPVRRVRESAFLLAKTFGVGSAMGRRIAFNSGANPEAARRRARISEGPAPTGQKGKPVNALTFQPITWGLTESAVKIKTKMRLTPFRGLE